jgi:hypothetical protein
VVYAPAPACIEISMRLDRGAFKGVPGISDIPEEILTIACEQA